jgi:3',5'-cyclic AMP phosphodiesterase CpdA
MTTENHPQSSIGTTATDKTFVLAHFSDPHISTMKDARIRDVLSKRLYGYLRWKLHRGTEHHGPVLSALLDDLQIHRPDHIAITGDLTHLSLPIEFQKVKKWLQSIGKPHQVTVIPGNHDAYVPTEWSRTHAHWTEYMLSDNTSAPLSSPSRVSRLFPSLRVRDSVAIIGVCTAHPSAPYLAVGGIGRDQFRKLEKIMDQAYRLKLFRVILIHHPPVTGTVSWRKRLTDAAEFRALVKQYGAELILHGHSHRAVRGHLPVPYGKVQVVGAPSASAMGRNHQRMARYYIYRITPRIRSWRVGLTIRVYSPRKEAFITENQEHFSIAGIGS